MRNNHYIKKHGTRQLNQQPIGILICELIDVVPVTNNAGIIADSHVVDATIITFFLFVAFFTLRSPATALH